VDVRAEEKLVKRLETCADDSIYIRWSLHVRWDREREREICDFELTLDKYRPDEPNTLAYNQTGVYKDITSRSSEHVWANTKTQMNDLQPHP
jgi:hypothetical protein